MVEAWGPKLEGWGRQGWGRLGGKLEGRRVDVRVLLLASPSFSLVAGPVHRATRVHRMSPRL
jgi:hypothetical protein